MSTHVAMALVAGVGNPRRDAPVLHVAVPHGVEERLSQLSHRT